MYLAGLIAQRDLPLRDMLDRYELYMYKQWLRVYMRSKMIKHNKDLFESLDDPLALLDKLHIYGSVAELTVVIGSRLTSGGLIGEAREHDRGQLVGSRRVGCVQRPRITVSIRMDVRGGGARCVLASGRPRARNG